MPTRLQYPAFPQLALVLALSAAMPATAQEALTTKGRHELPPGGTQSANAVNSAGNVIVGSVDGKAYLWNTAGEYRELSPISGSSNATANALNLSGTVVVGHAMVNSHQIAIRWTEDGAEDLGHLPNGVHSSATGVNGDGSLVVGYSVVNGMQQAFLWRSSDRLMENLGTLNNGVGEAAATAINPAGNVIVGSAADGNESGQKRAFRWVNGVMKGLGVLNDGDYASSAHAINASGDVVVGQSEGDDGITAFRWTESADKMESLGRLNGGVFSKAFAVNADGSVVVGQARDGVGGSSNDDRGFRWEAGIMQSVDQWLKDAGVAFDDAVKTNTATGVNADGTVVVGQLHNGRAYIARVTNDGQGGGSGLIDVSEYMGTLSAAASAVALPLRDADPVLHGAHGDPMGWLLQPSKTSIRVAGDFARTDRSGTDAEQNLGEVAVAHAFSPTLQGQIALGTTRSRQHLAFDGSARTKGTYLLPELIWQARPGLYATFSAYHAEGDLRLNRGYLNAGNPDFSYGETDTRTSAVRARLDWRELWRWNGLSFTPYTSLTLSRTRSDAYSEAHGGFPVQWNARKDKLDVLRVGLDSAKTFDNDVRLNARAELAHRVGGDERAKATGLIPGLMGFSVDSAATQRSEWLRLGLGVDLPLGLGRFSTTLNATTQGGAPTYWLAASYRVAF